MAGLNSEPENSGVIVNKSRVSFPITVAVSATSGWAEHWLKNKQKISKG
jgi:hypothetical protein